MIHSALQRTESRGAHQRTDFPERNDADFLAHSVVSRGEHGTPTVEYLPVKITRWPAGERVYGEQATEAPKSHPVKRAS
jgi:fumarate reductase flavoprotein subunit